MTDYSLYIYVAVLFVQIILAESFIAQISKIAALNKFIRNIIAGNNYETYSSNKLPYNTFYMLIKYSIINRNDKKYIESFTAFVISGFISSIFYVNCIIIIGVYSFTLNAYLFLIMLALMQINTVICIAYIAMVIILAVNNKIMLKNNKIRILCVDEKDNITS